MNEQLVTCNLQLAACNIHVGGIVQGVGFRPFVYGLAMRLGLTGWVRNSSAGVDIGVEGAAAALAQFAHALETELPPLAHIDHISIADCAVDGYETFEIIPSKPIAGAFQPISPDMTVCPDCLRELFDPADRRYRYPFINCTHCGPRFTIIKDIPYDRPLTTMAGFEMCADCAAEYGDPLDRRFHAQPIACPECGPHVWMEASSITSPPSTGSGDDVIELARRLLAAGQILAIKGIGGFHLACDGLNETAVSTLRRRKLRVDKPFALMMADVAAVEKHCYLNEAERALLTSRERPIVILRRREGSGIVTAVSPHQHTVGVMLPYTPLHALLLERAADFPEALVMTSGNLSDEPIAIANDEARERLAGLADAFLMHNRDIYARCDDSVTRVYNGTRIARMDTDKKSVQSVQSVSHYPLRRSRGYAPFPVKLGWEMPPMLAVGGELKSTFCLANGRYAFLSPHIGDLQNYETLQSFEAGIAHFEQLFRVKPSLIAYDAHPNYLASRYAIARAEKEGLTAVSIQHHHAHIAACMAEHGLDGSERVIGVAFDGTGYGDDGRIWGGEFLVADYGGYKRPFHLNYFPMAGGDTAVREPWRLALACLHQAGIAWTDDLPPVRYGMELTAVIRHQIEHDVNAPLTSSMGRLFDAVSALIGVRQTVNYEAQAAIELEMLIDERETGAYGFDVGETAVDPAPLFAEITADLRRGVPTGVMAAKFHNGVARLVRGVCLRIKQETTLKTVALSGGVWQNMALFNRTLPLLQAAGFTVLWHEKVPANDGGLALGQAVIAARKWNNSK